MVNVLKINLVCVNKLIHIIILHHHFIDVLLKVDYEDSEQVTSFDYIKKQLYTSSILYVNTQAFKKTTGVLRKYLHEDARHDFDFISPTDEIEEVKRIINCEVIKKNALIFPIAVTINFANMDWMKKSM